MSDLIAIGYPEETTAAKAAEAARELTGDLVPEPDAIATLVCDKEGGVRVDTSHDPVGAGLDESFREHVRELLQPGTSALVLVVEALKSDRLPEALSHYGGTVLKSSLSTNAEARVQDALRGAA